MSYPGEMVGPGLALGPVHTGTIPRVRYRTVPLRSVGRGVAFTQVRKKSSGPFQNRSRNWAVRKSEPEIGTIRYRTVPFSCEQKRYRTALVSTGDTKLLSMTTSG